VGFQPASKNKADKGARTSRPRRLEKAGKMPALLSLIGIHEHHLPHWQQGEVFYFVTYRLADALPAGKLGEWQEEKDAWVRRPPRAVDTRTEAQYHRRFGARIDEFLREQALLPSERKAE
jgi:hypothetical protein